MARPSARPAVRQRALSLVRRAGIARARDIEAQGVPSVHLRRLVAEGVLEQPARGQYRLVAEPPTENHALAVAARAAPDAIICLLSALRFHDLTTQTPHEVWVLFGAKAWAPTDPPTPLRLIRTRDLKTDVGVETHKIEGVRVRITSPERTVIECFKHRSTIGLDVAIEALRDLLRKRRGKIDELWMMAKAFRMQNVMRPYLDVIS